MRSSTDGASGDGSDAVQRVAREATREHTKKADGGIESAGSRGIQRRDRY
jgi:hypothetical protein